MVFLVNYDQDFINFHVCFRVLSILPFFLIPCKGDSMTASLMHSSSFDSMDPFLAATCSTTIPHQCQALLLVMKKTGESSNRYSIRYFYLNAVLQHFLPFYLPNPYRAKVTL
jgi:hypothetical protein